MYTLWVGLTNHKLQSVHGMMQWYNLVSSFMDLVKYPTLDHRCGVIFSRITSLHSYDCIILLTYCNIKPAQLLLPDNIGTSHYMTKKQHTLMWTPEMSKQSRLKTDSAVWVCGDMDINYTIFHSTAQLTDE